MIMIQQVASNYLFLFSHYFALFITFQFIQLSKNQAIIPLFQMRILIFVFKSTVKIILKNYTLKIRFQTLFKIIIQNSQISPVYYLQSFNLVYIYNLLAIKIRKLNLFLCFHKFRFLGFKNEKVKIISEILSNGVLKHFFSEALIVI